MDDRPKEAGKLKRFKIDAVKYRRSDDSPAAYASRDGKQMLI